MKSGGKQRKERWLCLSESEVRAVETWKGRSGEGRHGDAEGPVSEWGVNEKGKGPATVSVTRISALRAGGFCRS